MILWPSFSAKTSLYNSKYIHTDSGFTGPLSQFLT